MNSQIHASRYGEARRSMVKLCMVWRGAAWFYGVKSKEEVKK